MKRFYLWLFGLTCFFSCQAQLPKIDQQIRSIFQDSKGVYWFGTDKNGLFRFDGAKFYRFDFQ